MSRRDSDEYLAAISRIYNAFGNLLDEHFDACEIKVRLSEIREGYEEFWSSSGDSWMSHNQIDRALRSLESDLRRAKRGLDHPMLLRHVDWNHWRYRDGRSAKADINDALGAVEWALSNLEQDYSSGGWQQSGRQRRTRTSTRDQYLVPQLTWMILENSDLDVLGDVRDIAKVERIIRQVLEEWTVITGIDAAAGHHRIGRKPLRRLIRSAAYTRAERGKTNSN